MIIVTGELNKQNLKELDAGDVFVVAGGHGDDYYIKTREGTKNGGIMVVNLYDGSIADFPVNTKVIYVKHSLVVN